MLASGYAGYEDAALRALGDLHPSLEPPAFGLPPPNSLLLLLMVTVEEGGTATAVASVLNAWIRRQSGKVSVSATRPDGTEITVTADHVRGLTTEEVRLVVTQLGVMLEGPGAGK